MPITSYVKFTDNVAMLPIVGVVRQYDEPPLSLNTTDLPASWPMLPTGIETPLAFCRSGAAFPGFNLDLVVAYEAVGQSRQIENFSGALVLMDAVACALRESTLAKSGTSFTIRMDIVAVAGVAYWAIIANITANG